jgi:hypothetical protein
MIKINKDIDMDKLGMHICYNITNYLHTLPMFNKYKTFKVDVYTMGGEIVIAIYQTTSIMFYINAIWNIPSHGFSHFNDLDVNEMYKLCNDVINACYVFPLLVHVNQKTFAAEFKNMVQSLNK